MRQLAAFVVASLATFLGLLALLIALAIAEGSGLFFCQENCSPSQPLLGEVPPWRTIVAIPVSLAAGVVAARRVGGRA